MIGDGGKGSLVETILTFGGRNILLSSLVIALISAIAVGGALQLRIDTSYDSLISSEDSAWPVYNRTVETFGSDNTTIITITDEDLWNPEKLAVLEEVVFALEDLEVTESVDSLFTALNIRDDDGFLNTSPMMDYAPIDEEEAAIVRDNAIYSPLVRDNLLSEDGLSTAINVTVSRDRTDPEFNLGFYNEVEEIIAPLKETYGEVFQIGPPRLNVEIEKGMFADLSILSPISTLILIGSIIFFLKTPWSAGIPIATSTISILWTFGFMGYVDVPLTLLTAIVPSLIIVIGSTEDTHLLSAYLRGLQSVKDPSRKKAVRYMASHVGLPVFVTGFTTTVGFLSNGISDIPLIRDFAYASSFAMFANLIATIFVVPLLLTIAGPRTTTIAPEDTPSTGVIGVIQKALDTIGTKYGKVVLSITATLLVFFGYWATEVRVSNDPLSYFKPDHGLVQDADRLHERLSGMQIFYVTVDGKQEGAFRTVEGVASLEAIASSIRDTEKFDKVIGITDYLKLVNREINGGSETDYVAPDTEGKIAEYYLLFQRGDIERYVSPDYSRANIVVRHNISDSQHLNTVLAALEPQIQSHLPEIYSFDVAGENLMINRAAEGLFSGQIESLAILIGIIVLVMTALYTSILAGLVSMIPNLIPVLFNFGVMGLFDIPLNPGTATVAAIAVGIAIDDTIHLMTHYAEESRKNPDPKIAMRATVRAEAVPVISTSISLALGFGVLVFSEFNIVAQFGILAAMTMLYALVSDLLVTPLILQRMRLVGVMDMLLLNVDADILDKSPIFAGMSHYQIRKAILLGQLREHEAGELMVEQGTTSQSLFVVLDGKAQISIISADGTENQIGPVEPGGVIGEIGFSHEVERTANVRASEKTLSLVLERKDMEKALKSHPKISSALYSNLLRIISIRFSEQMKRDLNA